MGSQSVAVRWVMPLTMTRNEGETFRAAVERIAGAQGLASECLELFDADVAGGADEGTAAMDALYEWDCLQFESEEDV